jgi:hypothetical protein
VLYTGVRRGTSTDRLPSRPLDTRSCASDWDVRWGCQDLTGDSVCLLFVDIPRLVYFELGLDQP